MADLHVVTGAFGYSGKFIARKLLDAGHRVATLTNSPEKRTDHDPHIEVYPYNFDRPDELRKSLSGASVLYNTYWVRFNHRTFTHSQAVSNTLALFKAAKDAGAGRVIHVSITNPSEDSPFEYFRGKAVLERSLRESGLSHAILRPAVLFGEGDILVNNIAWGLRRFPVFGVFGDGSYRIQPIFVEDFAALAVEMGSRGDNATVDAIGPETFSYRELAEALASILGLRRLIVGVPPRLGYWALSLFGWAVRDRVLTWEEVGGLMAGLLCTSSAPAGTTKLTQWAIENRAILGLRYASELARRRRR